MTRRMELEMLISVLVNNMNKMYEEVQFEPIDKYLSEHGKISATQLQIDTYVKELIDLSK